MHPVLSLFAAFVMAAAAVPPSGGRPPLPGPHLDAAGHCVGGRGKLKMADCLPPPPPVQKCRDIKTKRPAKCDAPGTEIVPAG
jgi:hypothetical protein